MGCLWKDAVLTTWEFSSFFPSLSSYGFSFSSSSFYWLSLKLGSMRQILPVFYSLTAIKGQSLPFCGTNSQQLGTKLSLMAERRSQLGTSKIFNVLSSPTVQSKSWFLESEDPVISPLCALKFFPNSTRLNIFFQNLTWPSMLNVMI